MWQELTETRHDGEFLQLPPSTQILLPGVHEIYMRKSSLYLIDKASNARQGKSTPPCPSLIFTAISAWQHTNSTAVMIPGNMNELRSPSL